MDIVLNLERLEWSAHAFLISAVYILLSIQKISREKTQLFNVSMKIVK